MIGASPLRNGLFILMVMGCAPTETGNPFTVALSAHTSDPSIAALDGDGGVVIRSAWVGIGDVRFVMAVDCDDGEDTEVQLPGPFVVDLASDPIAQAFETPASDYCRVRVPLVRVRTPDASQPAELADHSLLIEGETINGVPFSLRTRVEPELDVRSRDVPFELGDVLDELVLSFDLARWFAGVDLDSGLPSADGVIRIGDEDNRALLDEFEDRVEEALELYEDADGDGRRDDGERRLAESGS